MDGILGSILQTLDEKNLRDTVNVIVTSDHGMTDISMQERVGTQFFIGLFVNLAAANCRNFVGMFPFRLRWVSVVFC